MNLMESLKRIPGLRPVVAAGKSALQDLLAIGSFCKERKLRHEGPIRVGFFCQYIPAWAKVEPIYEKMKEDPRFEPVLLALPSGIADSRLADPTSLENDTYSYLLEHGYTEAINTLVGKEQWLDLRSLDLSYLFYPRPYNTRIPRCYRPKYVCRYSRVCILMYGMTTTEDTSVITMNRHFMRYVYYYFAETSFAKRFNSKKNWLLHKLGLQKTLCIGYPVLEQLANVKGQESPSWDFSKNRFRILWTPRWSTDKSVGGSNFFTYRQYFLDYARNNPDVDILIRPHPLMFSNFLQTGEMTQDQVDDYKAQCAALPNVKLDDQQQYEKTLWGSSVMVTDLSGIVPEYFTTGKPVVFCMTNMELKLADYFQEMVQKGCYVANGETDMDAYLSALREGKDPMEQLRQALIPELFGTAGNDATNHIVEELAADALKRKRK